MKNNIIYKVVLTLLNIVIVVFALYLFNKFDTYTNMYVGDDISSYNNEIISIILNVVKIISIYIIVYMALANVITRKKYKHKGVSILAKILSVIVLLILIGNMIQMIFDIDNRYLFYILFLLLIPLLMVWSLSELFKLKYEIKDKEYIIMLILIVMFIVFNCLMFNKEILNYTLKWSFAFSFYVESILVAICLLNIYTLIVVRETNNENAIQLEEEKPKNKISKKKVVD